MKDFFNKETIEELSAIEHERWSHWQKYLHSKCSLQKDGSLLISKELVDKWDYLMNTQYIHLNESEKQSDREQVQRYIPLLSKKISTLKP